MASSTAFLNAQIHTLDEAQPEAEALLVQEGRITAVGREDAILRRVAATGARKVDAKGNTLLPGLVDSHTHLVHQGLLKHRVDLSQTRSLEEALTAVRRALPRKPRPEPLIAERWDESRWRERRIPRRDDLDALSRDIPIVLRRVDGHIAVGNTPACQRIAQRLPGVDLDSGLLVEEASLHLNQVFPTPPRDAEAALEAAQAQALRLGITTVHDFVVPAYLRAYQALHRRGRLRLRAHLSLYADYLEPLERLGLATGWGDDHLRLSGVKIFGDGSLGGHTAALHEPYQDQPENRGRLTYTDRQLEDLLTRAQRAGLRCSVHAIGDAAIDQAAKALTRLPRGLRHRIEHYELHTEASEELLARGGVVASMQPNFVGAWSRKGGLYEARIGARARRANEFQRLHRQGVPIAFGSDCMPLDPWFGLQSCLQAPFPRQRLRFPQALAAYSREGAKALGAPDIGRLRKGARADFLLARIDPRRLQETRVRATYVDGLRVA